MKRLLLFFLVLVSIAALSETRTRTHTFDFTNPKQLIPSVTPSPQEAGRVDVTDTVFQSPDGCVLISFDQGTSRVGADIVTDNAAGGYIPYLSFNARVTMIVKVKDDQVNRLQEFSCPTADPLGGVVLQNVTNYFGEDPYVPETRLVRVKELGIYRWQGDVASINFYNGGQQPTFHQFTVKYTLPREILEVQSTSPSNGSTVTHFDGFTLTYDSKQVEGSLKKTPQAEYSLTDSEGNSYELNVMTSGNKVTFTPKQRLTVAGLYTLSVAEGSFSDDADFCNVACTYSFTLAEQLDTFAATSISPEGKLESLANGTLVLTFPDVIGNINNNKQIILTNQKGAVVRTGGLEKVSDNTVKIIFTNDEDLTTLGIYTLLIPEGMVYDAENKHYNPEISYTYNIGNAPSDAQKLKVSQLLSMSGIGYPTFGSDARKALVALDETSSAADYDKAIEAYLAETDVEMPKANKYYYLVAIPNGTPKLYVAYNHGVVSLVSDIKSAVPLKLTGSGNTFQFATPDGRYLQLPGSSASSIGDDSSDLVLARLGQIDGVSNEETFGMLSVSSGNAYATVSVSTFSFSAPPSSTLSFSSALTSAFTLDEVPESELPEPTDDFKYDFVSITSIYYKEFVTQSTTVKDTYLNNMTLYTTDNGVDICVSDKEVEIVNYNTNQVVVSGKFVVIDPSTIPGATSAIKLKLNNEITEGSLPSGKYCYRIYEATYGDKNFGLYNTDRAAFLASGMTKADCHVNTYIYYILTVNNAGVDPVVDKPDPAVLTKAKEVLNYKGVGYPTANAQTRQALQRMVNRGEGTNDDFNAAIQDYYAETNIELPTPGNWYKMNAVTANGKKVYLLMSGSLTSSEPKNDAFKAGANGNAFTFSNIDDMLLSVGGSLTASPATEENSLTLARYPVSENNAEATFGMIVISGKKDGNDLVLQANATALASGSSPVLTDVVTSAFQFTTATEPVDPAPTPEFTLSPSDGAQVGGQQLEVTLAFTNYDEVTLADKGKINLMRDKAATPLASFTAKGKNAFVLKFENLTPDNYTLLMEEGAFTFKYKNRTESVQTIQATYIVLEKQVPSELVLAKAKEILAKTGIGYPVADSPARLELMRLMELKEGSDELFKAAIEAYLTDENIEKPANGKFYRITSRNQNESFPKYYFVLNGNKLKLQADAGQAAIFETMENADGTMTLATINEKYLTLPSNGECLSATYNQAIHNLALKRLSVEGVDAEETFGLISLSLNGNYSVLWFNSSMANIKDPSSTTSFGGYESSGFLFEEVDVSGIAMPDVEYTTIPGSNGVVETLEKVTVTFNTKNKVTLKDEDKIKLVSKDTNAQIKANSVSEVEGSANTFEIHFINTKAGGYNLNIAEGAFVVNFLGRVEPVQEINVSLWATKDVEIAYDFETFYNLAVAQPKEGEYISDTFLNNDFMLKADVPIALVPNAEPVVIKTSLGIEKAKGHFEKSTDSQMVRLILDNPLKPGDLKAGDIRVVIKKGTLCNEAYLQYLDAKEAISMSSCHINSEKIFHVSVDNEKAAQAIETVTVSGYDAPVYDLSGRKVNEKTVQTGVYVRDGKKYVVRRK